MTKATQKAPHGSRSIGFSVDPRRAAWARGSLEAEGFTGWIEFRDLRERLPIVPAAGGVYIVMRSRGGKARFRMRSCGGHFNGKDPTVPTSALSANWVEGARVLYIGKANSLRPRLSSFLRFGEGNPVSHWGGRLIWQIARSDELLIAWRETPGEIPKDVEDRLIDAFRIAYGKPPFANHPDRLGF